MGRDKSTPVAVDLPLQPQMVTGFVSKLRLTVHLSHDIIQQDWHISADCDANLRSGSLATYTILGTVV
jgi:hypothetical protein